jgi:hypothetical protein
VTPNCAGEQGDGLSW